MAIKRLETDSKWFKEIQANTPKDKVFFAAYVMKIILHIVNIFMAVSNCSFCHAYSFFGHKGIFSKKLAKYP